MQHPGVVDQGGQRTESVDHRRGSGLPLILGRHVEGNRDRRVATDGLDGGRQVVDQQIAGGDVESVLVQSLHYRRALSARGAGHQRDAIH
jgi:hypothetical protein